MLVLTRLWKLLSNFGQYKMQTTDWRLQIYFSHLFLVAFWVLLYDVVLACKDCASYFHRNLIFLGRETLLKKCTHTK